MLFIYLLDDHPTFGTRARHLLDRSYRRGDSLYTSYLALGEVMAGAEKSPDPQKALAVREIIREMGFSC
jgi:predicted nucleic acid-binding protein